jgi:DNA-directed RNA polymerase subunit beta
MFSTIQGQEEADDKDDLRFKTIVTDNDFILENIKKDWDGFLEKSREVLDTKKKPKVSDIRASSKIGKSLTSFMSSSNVAQLPDAINPLDMVSASRRVTQLGDGGMSSTSARNAVSARNIVSGSMNRLDPVETPESQKIGLVEHLSVGAIVDGKTIKAPVYKVDKGSVNTAKEILIDPVSEYDKVVAYNDSRYVKTAGKSIVFTKNIVPARHKGKTVEVPIENIDYVDKDPRNVLGYAAGMIPFVSHNDGNRTLMGANMQRQAVNLVNKEKPLVSSLYDSEKGETYEDFVGREFANL